jgi:NAD(P)H-hydrate epimerase
MVSHDPDPDQFTQVPDLTSYSAIGIGPGLGVSSVTAGAIKLLIQQSTIPVVFDADALNILSENKTWLGFLPPNSVLTPHPKEFERLAGKSADHFERNGRQREFSIRHGCYIVLKGAHTAITTPGGQCYFNTTGNPGMATAGSGDVLTGIITGLLAQGYTSLESSILGVFLHGLAGDLVVSHTGEEALIARDIINHLGKSFQHLYGKF